MAARRLVSAISLRTDRADALIDAVMVWENLVGTTTETSFRVTAALAKLNENDRSGRRDVQKKLQSLYSLRSRVVHGDEADLSKVDEAAARVD